MLWDLRWQLFWALLSCGPTSTRQAPPAVKVHVELISVQIEDDGDPDVFFGADDAGTILIKTTVTQQGHPGDAEEHPYGPYHPNADDANTTTININQPIYRHIECTPMNEPIEVKFKVTEVDWLDDDELAEVGGTIPLRTDYTGNFRQVGAATFTYGIVTGPVPAHDPSCQAGQPPPAASPKISMVLDPWHPYGGRAARSRWR
jgi:hypothetical protein